jgi:hypothetical protein
MAARMPMIAMTTSNSMSVNALAVEFFVVFMVNGPNSSAVGF